MQSPSPSRTFPLFALLALLFLLLLLPCPSVQAAAKPGDPDQSKNGQYGTANLPNAASNFIDWNKMQPKVNSPGLEQVVQNVLEIANQTLTDATARDFTKASNGKPTALVEGARNGLIHQLEIIHALLNLLKDAELAGYYQSFYFGTESRGGDGRTTFVAPEINYTNEKQGYALGAEYLAESGSENRRGPDSVGISFKYEITAQARSLIREFNNIHHARTPQAGYEEEKTIQSLLSLNESLIRQLNSNPLTDATTLRDQLAHFSEEITNTLKTIRITNFIADPKDISALRDHYLARAKSPALSAFVGSRIVNGGGSLSSGGVSASCLFPFRDGLPGVTLLYVVQGLHADLKQDASRGALSSGAALIFQDRTPAPNEDYLRESTPENPVSPLRPPWSYKFGVEYIGPALGLTKTYAGFVRYRDPRSYADITLTYGEDGQGKDYGEVSIGRSFTF